MTVGILNEELKTLVDPVPFGFYLNIPPERIGIIRKNHERGIRFIVFLCYHFKCMYAWTSLSELIVYSFVRLQQQISSLAMSLSIASLCMTTHKTKMNKTIAVELICTLQQSLECHALK